MKSLLILMGVLATLVLFSCDNPTLIGSGDAVVGKGFYTHAKLDSGWNYHAVDDSLRIQFDSLSMPVGDVKWYVEVDSARTNDTVLSIRLVPTLADYSSIQDPQWAQQLDSLVIIALDANDSIRKIDFSKYRQLNLLGYDVDGASREGRADTLFMDSIWLRFGKNYNQRFEWVTDSLAETDTPDSIKVQRIPYSTISREGVLVEYDRKCSKPFDCAAIDDTTLIVSPGRMDTLWRVERDGDSLNVEKILSSDVFLDTVYQKGDLDTIRLYYGKTCQNEDEWCAFEDQLDSLLKQGDKEVTVNRAVYKSVTIVKTSQCIVANNGELEGYVWVAPTDKFLKRSNRFEASFNFFQLDSDKENCSPNQDHYLFFDMDNEVWLSQAKSDSLAPFYKW